MSTFELEFDEKALTEREAQLVRGLVGMIADVYLTLAKRMDVMQGKVKSDGSTDTIDDGPLWALSQHVNAAIPGLNLTIHEVQTPPGQATP